MKRLLKITPLILLVLTIISCGEDDQISSREFPKLNTLNVSNITSRGATFNATFTFRGDFEITSYGFVWSTFSQNFTLENSDKVTIHENTNETDFSLEVSSALEESKTYYVRAFVTTDKFIVYGQTKEFISLGSNAPQIDKVSPLNIFYADTVSVSGDNFSFVRNNNTVSFGGTEAKIVSATDTLLIALVPESIQSINSKLSVSVAGNKAEYEETLRFLGPEITSLSKTEVVYGDTVEIQGHHLGYISQFNTIKAGDVEIDPIAVDSTKITLVVPVTDREFSITVANTLGQEAKSDKLTILDPIIVQLNPDEGFYGDKIEVRGENFGYIEEIVEVYFNDQRAEITSFSNASILAAVPEGINNPVETKVIVNEIETLPSNFYYLGPEFDSFSPQSGTWGDEVTIRGNNFSSIANENMVLVHGIEADIISSSNNEIVFKIPNDINSKSSYLTIEVNGIQVAPDEAFTLNDPIIHSISPKSVSETSELVTISGQNFHPFLNRNTIQYNGTSLTVQSVSPTELVVELSNDVLKNILISQRIEQPIQVSNSVGMSSSTSLLFNHKAPFKELEDLNFGGVTQEYLIGDDAYVITYIGYVYKFNFSNQSWSRISLFPGNKGTDGNRYRGTGFTMNGLIYYGMGGNANEGCSINPNIVCPLLMQNDFWVYNPKNDTWTQLNDSPLSGTQTQGFSSQGRSYLISDDGLYEYNSFDDSWIARTTIDGTFYSYTLHAASLNEEVIACYRTNSGGTDFSVYNPTSDSWSLLYSDIDLKYIEDLKAIGDNIYYTKITFTGQSNNYEGQLFSLNSLTLEIEEIPLPDDQIIFLPFKYGGYLYLEGASPSTLFYQYDPDFTP